MNRIIHQIYLGDCPEYMRRFMATVQDTNPGWDYRLWTENNLKEIGVYYHELLEVFKKPVHVSDYVRLVVVHHFGGIYLDCDVEGLKPLDPLLEYEACAAFQDGTGQICPAIFGASAGHPWLHWQIANAESYSRPDSPWNVDLMTHAPREGLTIVPTDWFYPWLWTTRPENRKPTPNSLCVHYWKGSWAPWFKREFPT